MSEHTSIICWGYTACAPQKCSQLLHVTMGIHTYVKFYFLEEKLDYRQHWCDQHESMCGIWPNLSTINRILHYTEQMCFIRVKIVWSDFACFSEFTVLHCASTTVIIQNGNSLKKIHFEWIWLLPALNKIGVGLGKIIWDNLM